MKKEDKELLLKDLCARLPYGVKVYRKWIAPLSGSPEEGVFDFCIFDIEILLSPHNWVSTEKGIREVRKYDIKPYLIPLSSMTEEQEDEWYRLYIQPLFDRLNVKDRKEDLILQAKSLYVGVDYLIANHFDYRGLIEQGLAINATGLNIYE